MIVTKFGVRKFLAGEALAHAEMRAAAQYYQSLVSIERWRRQRYGEIRSKAVPGLGEIDEAYQALDEWIGEHVGQAGKRGTIRAKRQKATSAAGKPVKRAVDVSEEVDAITELKKWRKAAAETAKPLRAQFDGIVGPPLEEHRKRSAKLRAEWKAGDGDRHAKRRSDFQAREEMLGESTWPEAWRQLAELEITADALRGWMKEARLLCTGTYHSIQRVSLPAACKKPRPRADGEPRRPKRRPTYSRQRLRRIGWEIKGCTWADVVAGRSNDLRITDLRDHGGGNGGRVKQRATVHMRLRAETRDALEAAPSYYRPTKPDSEDGWWVRVDVVLHRRIPDDTRVSWAFLVPFEVSPGKWDYTLQLSIEPTAPLIQRAPGVGTVEVRLCWTQDDDTLIVARLNGEPLRLPGGPHERGRRPGPVRSLRYAEHLVSASDKMFDGARAELSARLAGLPDRVQALCGGLPQWRAHWKLRRVSRALLESLDLCAEEYAHWKRWRDTRRAAGKDLYEPDLTRYAAEAGLTTPITIFAYWLEMWRRKDEHMEEMAAAARRYGMGRRTEFYRVTAARLATQFERCEITGAVDLAGLAIRDKAEDAGGELHQAARHNRQLACVHELKLALKNAFGPERYHEREPPSAAEKPGTARKPKKTGGNDAGEDGAASAAAE